MIFQYDVLSDNPGWISMLVPCPSDAGQKLFYGPNILNIRIFTNYSALGRYNVSNLFNDPHVQRLVESYSTFANYGTLVVFDIAALTQSPPDPNIAIFDAELDSICLQLSDYGFSYLGQVNSNSLNPTEYVSNLVTQWYSVTSNQT